MHIEANAFLLHMVRNIASALRDVGCGEADTPLAQLLLERNRAALGITAPPDGLYLTGVGYAAYDFPAGHLPPFIDRG